MTLLRSHELLNRRSSRLLLIDVQEKLVPALPPEFQHHFLETCRFVCEGARLLGIPIVASEQYPERLGPTVASLTEFTNVRPAKRRFSAAECTGWPTAADDTDDRFQIVVAGLETHVCVLQTVLDLIAMGYQVYVVVDAVAARSGIDHAVALERMKGAGATMISAESVLFEWCETSEAAEFKSISTLVKNRMQDRNQTH